MAPDTEPRVMPTGPAIAPRAAPVWPPARAALTPRATPPTVPMAAPAFMAGWRDATLGEWQRGHCNDMGEPPWCLCHPCDVRPKKIRMACLATPGLNGVSSCESWFLAVKSWFLRRP